jgi:hypothetical protein
VSTCHYSQITENDSLLSEYRFTQEKPWFCFRHWGLPTIWRSSASCKSFKSCMGRSFRAVTLIQNPSGHRTWRTSFGRQTQIVIERYPHFYLQSVFPVETINSLQRHSCEVLYPNIFLSALMGSNSYQYVANTPWLFGVAEHLCVVDVFGAHVLDSDAYLAEIERACGIIFQSRRCTTQVVRPNYPGRSQRIHGGSASAGEPGCETTRICGV